VLKHFGCDGSCGLSKRQLQILRLTTPEPTPKS
jgi:hypothetical protein